MKIFFFFTLAILFGVNLAAAAKPAPPAGPVVSVEDLSDRQYLSKVLEKLQGAQKSIDVSMYQILLSGREETHPVFQILHELVKAKTRGVNVRVLLNTHRDYDAGDTVSLARSLAAVDYLVGNGIEVSFADPLRRVHDKLIVIDDRCVVQGSMNWTQTALLQNFESAALIDSPAYAAAILTRIHMIPLRQKQILDSLGDEGPMLQIPAILMKDDQYFSGMLEDKDERIFEFYLALLTGPGRGLAPLSGITLPDRTLYTMFRLDPAKSQQDNRREAVRLLKKLEAQGLIDLNIPETGAEVHITVTFPQDTGEDDDIQIPLSYFDQGYPARLSFAAEFFYLIARLEMAQSSSAPWWWRSEEELSQKYHIHHTTLAEGMLELQRANLIEIVRDDAPPGRPLGERLVNRYRVNPITHPAKQEAAFNKLKEKYGEDKFKRAQYYADKIDEPNDPEAAAVILKWMEIYPFLSVEAAFSQVAGYEHNNPRRSLYYIEGILRNMTRG